MCRCDQNVARSLGQLIYIILFAAFFFGLTIIQTLASDQVNAAKTRTDAERRILTKEDFPKAKINAVSGGKCPGPEIGKMIRI